MAKEKNCCDIQVTKTKGGFRLDIKGKDVEKCMEACLKRCCGLEAGK